MHAEVECLHKTSQDSREETEPMNGRPKMALSPRNKQKDHLDWSQLGSLISSCADTTHLKGVAMASDSMQPAVPIAARTGPTEPPHSAMPRLRDHST